MAANKFGGGEAWDLPVPYAGGITSGQGMQVGAFLFGIAQASAPQNANVAVDFEGVYRVTKEAPLVIAQGAKLWWDNTNRRVTTTATSNIAAGVALAAALSADTEVLMLVGARVPAVAA
jgi:predicted RecA/RadA family phage recombinase